MTLKTNSTLVESIRISFNKGLLGLDATDGAAAGMFNLSRRTFQRRLKEEGFSYHKIVIECRLEKVKILLLTTDLNMKSIAYQVQLHRRQLDRFFKQRTGVTPANFRWLIAYWLKEMGDT